MARAPSWHFSVGANVRRLIPCYLLYDLLFVLIYVLMIYLLQGSLQLSNIAEPAKPTA